MVKRFIILPSDHQWLDIIRVMEEKGMPVEVQGDEAIYLAWHQGWVIDGVTYMEFAESPNEIGPGWIRPDERDPEARRQQRESEGAQAVDEIRSMAAQVQTVT